MSAFQKREAADRTVAFPLPSVGNLSMTSCKLNMCIYAFGIHVTCAFYSISLGFFFLGLFGLVFVVWSQVTG